MNMMKDTGNLMYAALASKYEAEIKAAVATLSIYFNNSVGIGEHPQQLEEMDNLIDKLSNAQDKFENLKKYFDKTGELQENVLKMD